MSAVLPWLAIVLVFGAVIFVHELGHFLAAKAVGVYAPRFSIGFGPALWSRKWGETEYVLAAVPLGGYVRMASREDETMARIEGGGEGDAEASRTSRWYDPAALVPFGPNPVPENRLFESKSLPSRLVILLAGVTMNILLGWGLLVGLAWATGTPVVRTRVIGAVRDVPGAPLSRELAVGDTILAVNGRPVSTWNDIVARVDSTTGSELSIRTQRGTVAIPLGPGGAALDSVETAIEAWVSPVIDQVVPDYPAARAGLEHGDSIIALDGAPVRTWSEMVHRIEHAPGRPIDFTVVRGGSTLHVTIRPDSTVQADASGKPVVVGKIGAAHGLAAEREPVSFGRAVVEGWNATWSLTGAVVTALHQLVTGSVSVRTLSGPVAIGRASYDAAKAGWASVVSLIALLSVNLAVFNLLPIPILDGGQIVLNIAERVKGSALSLRTRENLMRFGLAAIALLFVIVMYNDITSWLRNAFGL